MSLLDRFLPEFQVRSRHQIEIQAPPETVYEALNRLNLARSFTLQTLFRLRGLPAASATWKDIEKMGFVRLQERPNREILFGIIGKFWILRGVQGHLKRVDPEGFRAFSEEGFAKGVWYFGLESPDGKATSLSTETRVFCLGKAAERRFRLYWVLIGPFSGWIRKIALRRVKEEAESAVLK